MTSAIGHTYGGKVKELYAWSRACGLFHRAHRVRIPMQSVVNGNTKAKIRGQYIRLAIHAPKSAMVESDQ